MPSGKQAGLPPTKRRPDAHVRSGHSEIHRPPGAGLSPPIFALTFRVLTRLLRNHPTMKLPVSGCVLLFVVTTCSIAQPPDVRPPPPPEAPRSAFVFSLLPKSLQKHPELDYHVICEMTDAGRKLPPPTPQRPVYYIEQPGKFTQL